MVLFHDDFSQFKSGKFPSDYYATREYHYLPPRGEKGSWYEPVISYKWRHCNAAWIIIEKNGQKQMLSILENDIPFDRMLVTRWSC